MKRLNAAMRKQTPQLPGFGFSENEWLDRWLVKHARGPLGAASKLMLIRANIDLARQGFKTGPII